MSPSYASLWGKRIGQIDESSAPDTLTEEEQRFWEKSQEQLVAEGIDAEQFLALQLKRLEIELKQQELLQRKDEHKLRKKFSSRLYRLICVWLFVLMIILLSTATSCIKIWPTNQCTDFVLSDKVIITLLTSTTVTVLGLFVTVLKYMFGNNGINEKPKKEV